MNLRKFLLWATSEGQTFASDLHYAKLPSILQERVQAQIERMEVSK